MKKINLKYSKLFKMKASIAVLLVLSLFLSCDAEDKLEAEISEIPVDFKVERFDHVFASATVEELPKIREVYPFLLPERESDSMVMVKQMDSLQQQLFLAVDNEFGDLSDVDDGISKLFQHLKYYDTSFSEPRVIALTSYVDYRNKTIVTDSIMLIALDTYLGAEHEFYGNIPKYITQNMNRDQIVSDLATNYAEKYLFQSQKKTLLDEMVYFGKQLYFKDKIIPFKAEEVRMGYTPKQMQWAQANEFMIWTHFIEEEMLYSTDSSLPNRFIAPAPFSKFYLELDNEAPGRLGQFIGWQMVRSYMENNDTPLLKMMEMEAEDIFNKSRYKPNK